MKTAKDIIHEYGIEFTDSYANDQWDNISEAMQEYAEKYAKAGIRHTLDELGKAGYSIGPLSEAEAFFLQSFKEYLKK